MGEAKYEYTLDELAKNLGCKKNSLYRDISDGTIRKAEIRTDEETKERYFLITAYKRLFRRKLKGIKGKIKKADRKKKENRRLLRGLALEYRKLYRYSREVLPKSTPKEISGQELFTGLRQDIGRLNKKYKPVKDMFDVLSITRELYLGGQIHFRETYIKQVEILYKKIKEAGSNKILRGLAGRARQLYLYETKKAT